MKTDIITIKSDLGGHDLAMETAEKFAVYHGISERDARHLRLLTEETVSMVHGILDAFEGKFWMESEKTKDSIICRICLSAEKQVTQEQETQILSVSTSGKNENARGVMGKIRELLRRSLQMPSEADEQYLQNVSDAWLTTGSNGFSAADSNYWSLQLYRNNLSPEQESRKEEWDELEKSIIAKLADEVKVWLNNNSTTVVIEKNFPVSSGGNIR